MTTTTEHTGTDRYLAIELLNDETMLPTPSSDIHALGCLGLEVSFLYPATDGSITMPTKVMFSRKPHAQRKSSLRGGVIQDIKRGLPPASRVETFNIEPGWPRVSHGGDLDSVQATAWTLLELCWHPDPGLRPAAERLVKLTEALLIATSSIEDNRELEDRFSMGPALSPLQTIYRLPEEVTL